MAEEYCNHLTIDAITHGSSKLMDENLIKEVLSTIPKLVNMRILKGPSVMNCITEVSNKNGLSGYELIGDTALRESHVHIHTFPQKRFFSFDIYSCRPFKPSIIINYLKSKLKIKEMKINKLNRPMIVF